MLKQLMICMHTANVGFLILETLLNSIVSNFKYTRKYIFKKLAETNDFSSCFSRSLGLEWDILCYGVVSTLSSNGSSTHVVY